MICFPSATVRRDLDQERAKELILKLAGSCLMADVG